MTITLTTNSATFNPLSTSQGLISQTPPARNNVATTYKSRMLAGKPKAVVALVKCWSPLALNPKCGLTTEQEKRCDCYIKRSCLRPICFGYRAKILKNMAKKSTKFLNESCSIASRKPNGASAQLWLKVQAS